MNRILRMACMAIAAAGLFSACTKSPEPSYLGREQQSLREWMQINRPQLLENYQSAGDYYVDVLDLGSSDAEPIKDTATWVRFTFTGRNLAGDIVLTRNEVDARQVGSYTPYTYYVPYFRFYAGDDNTSLLEGTYLAMHNALTLGKEYAEQRGYPQQVLMRYGTKVTLYMPSSVVSTDGLSGSGGYEGQSGYVLNSGCPLIVTMEITDTIRQPLVREFDQVKAFAEENGELKPVLIPRPSKAAVRADGDMILDQYNDGYMWRYVKDSVADIQVFVNLLYTPTTKFKFSHVYPSVYAPYNDFAALEQNICDTLANRFGPYDGPQKLDQTKIPESATVKIWYIARFLDGFIIDSNIPGVRSLVFGETSTKATALSYRPQDDDMIKAFYYAIQRLIYGQWAAILTTSTFAYGATGNSSTSDDVSYDYSNYYGYMNNYYGSSGYYDNLYGSYYNSGLLNWNTGVSSTASEKTSISTEIPPFTPLLFQIYIEPDTE